MIQVPPNIAIAEKGQKGTEAANYLERIVNDMARKGWEFYRIDTIGVQVNPGCLGALTGKKQELIDYYVISFRKEITI
jgi:hypothetical protein